MADQKDHGVEVDETRCIGTGNCEFVAPKTFALDDQNISRVVGAGDPDDLVDQAIRDCPAKAIRRRPADSSGPRVQTTLRLDCPCGARIVGAGEDELVERVQAHLAQAHPHLVGHYSRDEILMLAF